MTTNPWLVPVTALRRSIGCHRHETRVGRIGELNVAGSTVPGDAEAEADAELISIDGGIEVEAEVAAPWRGECRRCLRPVTGRLRCDVREVYRPRKAGEEEDADEETYPLKGEMLDLSPLVRDALLLELPIAPLCRDDCLGLCPGCGAELNEGPCQCSPAAGDPRWSALDALRGEPADDAEDGPGD
jgi:uncharacterized protein